MKNVVVEHFAFHKSKYFKGETGITLIALIITIIILIILAAVSIRAAYNSGIIDYAINGTKKYIEKGKEEESINSETEGIIASLLSKLDEIENGDTENNNVPDLLRKYVLGADESGRDLYDILDYDDTCTFYNDANSIADAHDTVIYLNELWGGYIEPNEEAYVYIKYNNVGYKIVVDTVIPKSGDITLTTTNVIKIYEPNGAEGEIVQYSIDGTVAGTENWLVLYDNGEAVDITPVELDNSWTYTLGSQDLAAITALPSGDNLERAIWSYNNVVDTLNAYCADEIVTNNTAQAVRSIGTGFGVTDTNTYYSSEFLANNPAGWEGEYNRGGERQGKERSLNAEQDVVRMSYFSPGNSYETYGFANTNEYYCLASRSVSEYSGCVYFGLYYIDNTRSYKS